ncbi:hypothetical protein ERO13_A09G105550v2 [Gossypium hirsutum]|uniref:Uncharacterized protein n=1 Tax=Gossypium darwinii TaxID=34276 RepID=A0A5D2FCP9_GOSDA|nr:hypothetical protein ERO13_A09G105550v2 [Gossypium hirsutum]TYH02329.1 hypothetical protein ES288_A09G132100v1 [Gossypium darwinii]
MVMATINAFYCIPTSLDNNAVGILLQIIFPIYLLTILHRRWSYYVERKVLSVDSQANQKAHWTALWRDADKYGFGSMIPCN